MVSARRGWHEDLEPLIGVAFDRRGRQGKVWAPDGLLDWRGYEQRIQQARPSTSLTCMDKQLELAGCMLEAVYDLCLSSAITASDAPGFEVYLGALRAA